MNKILIVIIVFLAVAFFAVAAHGQDSDCGTLNNPRPCLDQERRAHDDAVRERERERERDAQQAMQQERERERAREKREKQDHDDNCDGHDSSRPVPHCNPGRPW
jgi:hypothetical protein